MSKLVNNSSQNLLKELNTHGNHHTTTHSKLDQVATNTATISNPTNKVSILSSSGVAVYADTSPAPTLDMDDNRSGWLHKKLTGTEKFNYYFYYQGSKAKTLDDLNSVCANVRLDTWDNSASCPFFVVSTKPTGVGDAGAWFHSRIAYACDSEIDIILGEHVELCGKNMPTSSSGLRRILLSNVITTGEAIGTEEILTISFHSDSGSVANTQSMVSKLGWEINNIDMRMELV